MIDVEKFVGVMKSAGVDFFTGVPDSLLKSFCAYVTDTCGERHVIAAVVNARYAYTVKHVRKGLAL